MTNMRDYLEKPDHEGIYYKARLPQNASDIVHLIIKKVNSKTGEQEMVTVKTKLGHLKYQVDESPGDKIYVTVAKVGKYDRYPFVTLSGSGSQLTEFQSKLNFID